MASGKDSYSDEETENLPEELQLLDPSVEREADPGILKVLLETLLLWTTEREGREEMRKRGVYFIVRECHLAVEEEGVREECERLVNILMRDEELEDIESGKGRAGEQRMNVGQGGEMGKEKGSAEEEESDEDDNKVVEIL